ncbi:hypothetical protein BJ165DRAFT_1533516 [Panaeolus papilionaceus]|nr:hypothetical protein BJ165DRAFT_1533516 [Panaeolus papilionaceus]
MPIYIPQLMTTTGAVLGLETHTLRKIPQDSYWPTGSGKIWFVEAFAGSQALGIAKDQLDSVTHEVRGYRLVNCKALGSDICLVDTPGFLDDEISEFRVFRKIAAWMEENALGAGFQRILYFDRITDIPMSYGRLKSLKLLQHILKVKYNQATNVSQRHVVHVTSMWNRLSRGETWARALGQFEELRASPYLWNCYQHAVYISKFDGSLRSASNVLSGQGLFIPVIFLTGCSEMSLAMEYRYLVTRDLNEISDIEMGTFDLTRAIRLSLYLRTMVLGRIFQARERLSSLAGDLSNATGTKEPDELVQILIAQKNEAERRLLQLLDDCEEFSASLPSSSTPSLLQRFKVWIKGTLARKRS